MTNNEFIKSIYKSETKKIVVDFTPEFNEHWDKFSFFEYHYNKNNVQLEHPGQIFLYEYYDQKGFLSYPKIGIFLNYLPCDQTIEIEWVNRRRTWESNKKFSWLNNEDVFLLSEVGTTIQSLTLWDNTIFIYGVWDSLPNWKTLKKYYYLTWWFHRTKQESRNLKLNLLFT